MKTVIELHDKYLQVPHHSYYDLYILSTVYNVAWTI